MKLKNLTHRQLAEMMSNGWGEWMHKPSHSGIVYTTYKYVATEADTPIRKNTDNQEIVVRKWGELVWSIPTEKLYKEYCVEKQKRSQNP